MVNEILEGTCKNLNVGWYILPITPNQKVPPLINWREESSSDPEKIKEWRKKWPDANIGLDCGKSGLVVIDVDKRDNGISNWLAICEEYDIDTDTLQTVTPSGGRHVFFKVPAGVKITNHSPWTDLGIDIRGDGGYVLLPPSKTANGVYRFYFEEIDGSLPEIILLPDFLTEFLKSSRTKTKKEDSISEIISVGTRNTTLTSIAGSMRKKGISEAGIEAALLVENKIRCEEPLPEDEVLRIAKSISRYEPGTPPSKPFVKYVTNRDTITSLFEKVIKIIAPTERFFSYSNQIVYIEPGAGIIPLDSENLNGYLLKYFEIKNVTINSNKVERLANYQVIARNHVNMFLSSPEIKAGLPILESYTKIPIFDENWNLVSQPGYHSDQKVFYDGPIIDPRYRLDAIDEMLKEVHWKEPSDRANFIGIILTGLTIDRWIGRHPLMVLNANKSQVGKSTLARMMGIILGAVIPSTVGYNSNQIEFEKSIATEIGKGGPVVIIDNVKGTTTSTMINSPVLERCITDFFLNFRRLGSNTNINRRNDVIFITTMNDSKFSRDLQNRDIPINLESHERVQDIKYSIPNIDEWLLVHRLDIISEAIGMICIWRDQGCKMDSGIRHTISSKWAQTIDSILKANGILGFLDNYEESNRAYDENYDLMVEICEKYHHEDFRGSGEWANLLNQNLLKEKLSDKKGNLKSERSQSVTVAKLFKDYIGEKISCEAGDFTIEKKLLQTRPQRHAYRFKNLIKKDQLHDN
jgi:hypothetical protein